MLLDILSGKGNLDYNSDKLDWISDTQTGGGDYAVCDLTDAWKVIERKNQAKGHRPNQSIAPQEVERLKSEIHSLSSIRGARILQQIRLVHHRALIQLIRTFGSFGTDLFSSAASGRFNHDASYMILLLILI